MSLQPPVLTFKPDGLEVRTLYQTEHGPNPGTKTRRRGEVTQLVSSGLREASEGLERRVDLVGTLGFETREDTLSLDGRAT